MLYAAMINRQPASFSDIPQPDHLEAFERASGEMQPGVGELPNRVAFVVRLNLADAKRRTRMPPLQEERERPMIIWMICAAPVVCARIPC